MTRIITRLDDGFVRSQFNTSDLAPRDQLLAYSDLVTRLADVPPAKSQIKNGFTASVDSYVAGEFFFLDSYTDALHLNRSVARLSVDASSSYIFHLVLDGGLGEVTGLYRKKTEPPSPFGILAIDMGQPIFMHRPRCRVFNLMAPRALVESMLPDAETIHGRFIAQNSPLVGLIYNHLIATRAKLPEMSASEAREALHQATCLIVSAFGKEARLTGNARAAARAAILGQSRRYIDNHLHLATLSPEEIMGALQLPRHTLFRLFEHEGGVETYIRNRRLRVAAEDLVCFPNAPVTEIAYGVGFNSP